MLLSDDLTAAPTLAAMITGGASSQPRSASPTPSPATLFAVASNDEGASEHESLLRRSGQREPNSRSQREALRPASSTCTSGGMSAA